MNKKSKLIFILGSGRSGTHWVGNILTYHPDIRSTVESWPMFSWSKKMALYPKTQEKYLSKLVKVYKIQRLLSFNKHYLDKSHTNIWIADKLHNSLDNSYFIGIIRNPYSTVSSMLKHFGDLGVTQWIHNWKKYPIPNKFLGITEKNKNEYDKLSLASKCTLRVLSHNTQMNKLKELLYNKLLVLDYDDLQLNIKNNLEKLQNFLALEAPIPKPHIKTKSLDKWKNNLTNIEKKQISDTINKYR